MRNYNTGDEIKIINIKDKRSHKHLIKYTGEKGTIISWLIIEGVVKYKVMIKDSNEFTAYFKEDEIELLETNELMNKC